MEENKRLAMLNLAEALRWTRAYVYDLELDADNTHVVIRFTNGYWKRINVECDSAIAMMRDVLKAL